MKKTIYTLGNLFVILFMLFSLTATTQARSTQTWGGVWQAGPDIPATLWSGTAGEGIARFSAAYYPENGRVYFLGGRRDNDSTTGVVFYFDPVSKTFTSTGTTMPVPVSNYSISTLEDGLGHGRGMYVAGGRTAGAGQTDTLQVYYPADNTTANITTDPVPGEKRNLGGQVTVGNKLYVFGGFDGATMYDATYVYDPTLTAGSRWTDLNCPLPTSRSYISAVAVGTKIYAIGGDEYTEGVLTPISQTLVLDTADLASCWQDGLMADLPQANGDAPAVYIGDGYLGGTAAGAIYVIGGYWPLPGPYRLVWRYDLDSDSWEAFPELSIASPATGRRNQAAVYVYPYTKGMGIGLRGIWTFGGFDGSATNSMTNTSEYFSVTEGEVILAPLNLVVKGSVGDTINHPFTLFNQTGAVETFNLSVTTSSGWETAIPASIGPLGNLAHTEFNLQVTIPAGTPCPSSATFNVTATSQSDPLDTDSQEVTVTAVCSVKGVVTDANTGLPVENAYVWMQTDPDGLTGEYYDDYTDASGVYALFEAAAGDYYLGASAQYYQPTFYQDGWPSGATLITVPASGDLDISLDAAQIEMPMPTLLSARVVAGTEVTLQLPLNNTGAGPLRYNASLLDPTLPEPPKASPLAIPSLPRVDPKITTDINTSLDGTADFVVVLNGQADLSAAAGIKDWNARGQYVYDTLKGYADRSQTSLRLYLDKQGLDYTPLYIINAMIVRGGNQVLVSNLAGRSDVAQIVANHPIAVEQPNFFTDAGIDTVIIPQAYLWNINVTRAPNVWAYGVRGENIVVAEIDTGVQWDHPTLIIHYRGWNGVSADHNYNWFDPYGQSTSAPADENGHGTHVMGTMVGADGANINQIGMAPGAKYISCKGYDNVSHYLLTTELLQCAQWMLAPTDLSGANPDAAKRPHIINNSWGGGAADYWFTGAVDAWRAAGIFPQFSNGNGGPACSTASSPGDYWNVFTAGATTDTNAIASFSSRGPALNTGILKPDISAPGDNIRSSVPTNLYANYSGTSMASPHVAGAVALLWSSNPELIGQIDLTAWILRQTAAPLTTSEGCGGDGPADVPNNTYGYGLLDIKAAVDLARTGTVTPDWVRVDPAGGDIPAGSSGAVTLVFTPDASWALGSTYATLWLVSDEPYNPDIRIPVEMNVVEPVFIYLPFMRK